jgi:hypothetical protein
MDRFPWGYPVWGVPVWLGFLLAGWWESTRHALGAAGGAAHADPTALRVGIAVALGARALAWMGEAGFYSLAWRAAGSRLPYVSTLFWITTLSVTDLAADAVRRVAAADGAIAPAWALLLGPGALAAWRDAGGGVAAALGNAGAITLARILGTAHVQARMLGAGHARPLALTLTAWLASRVAIGWLADLARGRSVLP